MKSKWKASAAAGAAWQQAELILHVLDASEPLTAADEKYLAEFAGKKRILVRNKIDLPARLELPASSSAPVVDVCCLTGRGLRRSRTRSKSWSGRARSMPRCCR